MSSHWFTNSTIMGHIRQGTMPLTDHPLASKSSFNSMRQSISASPSQEFSTLSHILATTMNIMLDMAQYRRHRGTNIPPQIIVHTFFSLRYPWQMPTGATVCIKYPVSILMDWHKSRQMCNEETTSGLQGLSKAATQIPHHFHTPNHKVI